MALMAVQVAVLATEKASTYLTTIRYRSIVELAVALAVTEPQVELVVLVEVVLGRGAHATALRELGGMTQPFMAVAAAARDIRQQQEKVIKARHLYVLPNPLLLKLP